ncbi:hypothetical protein [Krasilnikoviella flava]|uniref:Uncharacterized protein n=1 Tax=Krasilnikoviella flava TaxID=526729 RepID=A0A1T5IR21_9MICO|nr:hypothetical protein [Krasilnikoviella flava]SKC41627.1 hypothetical protein SAMN04324258_0831 [Krasilnikoviella flava]
MSEHPTERDRPDEDDPRHQAERERAVHDGDAGQAADVGAVPGEKPKDDPDEEGEDRFDAG